MFNQVRKLFEHHEDLLEEFAQFLPADYETQSPALPVPPPPPPTTPITPVCSTVVGAPRHSHVLTKAVNIIIY